jgi:hypothetical protein
MPNFHIEVHSRDRLVEHYIVQSVENEQQAALEMSFFYSLNGHAIASSLAALESDPKYQYYIFRIVQLPEKDSVIFISGEYRSQFPI